MFCAITKAGQGNKVFFWNLTMKKLIDRLFIWTLATLVFCIALPLLYWHEECVK